MRLDHISPGTAITIRRQRWRVDAVSRSSTTTRVDATRVGSAASVPTPFFAPFDIIDARPPRPPRRMRRQQQRARAAAAAAWAEHPELPLATLTARIDVLPYQLEPWLAVCRGHRRVLIADDVGLGKTIQAGLIVAELRRRRHIRRSLIVTPGHLCAQWQQELASRFAVSARHADAATLAALAADLPRDTNAWLLDGVWITSIDFVKQAHVLDAMPPDPWDLVILDEAHIATGHSDRRAAAAWLTRRARHVLLLTATPTNGLDDSRVLRGMGAFTADDELVVLRRKRSDVGLTAYRRVREVRVAPSGDEVRTLDLIDAFSAAALSAATTETADATHLLVSVLAKRALSTAFALARTVERRLAFLARTPTESLDAIQPALDFGDDDDVALHAVIGLSADRERSWMRRLDAAARAAARHSRKLAALARLLRRTSEPVIVFTEFRDSLDAAVAALHAIDGIVIAHGGVTAVELRGAFDRFTHDDARVLIATDVASQGLNLHHRARWVIHLDLPWNPIRLEQRAGRVDRIGQSRRVHVTQLVMAHARDAAFRRRLAAREAAAFDERALPCDDRWRRRARAVAKTLQRRRELAGGWRGTVREVREVRGVREVRVRELATERALLEQLLRDARLGAQGRLPGTLSAADIRHDDQRAAAFAAAIRVCHERIAALEPHEPHEPHEP